MEPIGDIVREAEVKNESGSEKEGVNPEVMAVVRKVVEAGESESVSYRLVKDEEGKNTGEKEFLNTSNEILKQYEELQDPGGYTELADVLVKNGWLGPSSVSVVGIRSGEVNDEVERFATVVQLEVAMRPIRERFLEANMKDGLDYKGKGVASRFLKDWEKGLKESR
jgi:hypothetical protein